MTKASGFFAGAFVAVIVILGFRSAALVAGYEYQPDMADAASSTAVALIAVTLFVERGMTVINSLLFGDVQRDAEFKVMTAQAGGADELKTVMGQKERVRLFGAFVAGLFISAAGVRTLEGLLQTSNAHANALLFPVDVVLTAALIAGGSNGLSFMLQLAKDKLAPPPGAQAPVAQATGTTASTANTIAAANSSSFRARLTTTG